MTPRAAATWATVNTLNQYPSLAPMGGSAASLTYDNNGNLTFDGVNTLLMIRKTG